jgi:Flp pilus assembly pilin Flp
MDGGLPTAHAMDDAGRRVARGQSLAEYALIVALIVIVALVALTFFGDQINDILSSIADTING